jgi:outer membrane lipoprotein-sorting protein
MTLAAAGLFAARSAGAGAGDLLARIAVARAPVKTMQGPFTQTRVIGLLSSDVKSQGTLSLVRPDRLRWALGPPDDVTFWVGPEGLAYRSAHGEGRLAAGAGHLADSLEDLHALLGGDLASLDRHWTIRVVRDDGAGAELEATARAPSDGSLRAMTLALAADLVRPRRAVLVEGPRDRTTIEFGDVTVNAPIDERAMRAP